MSAKLIIHGGFFSESATHREVKLAKQAALKDIVVKGKAFLDSHSALDTVVYVVSLLEDCDLFNAGLGSQIQRDGKIRLSAALMDGSTLRFSGVINIENVRNPVCVAQRLLEERDRVLGGPPAMDFARAKGFESYNPETGQRRKEYQEKLESLRTTGTVGCVALDADGKLAAATSTGGKGFEIPGRVSDSATVAGNYADATAAISCTGVGEDIVSGAVAARIAARVSDGMPLRDAVNKTLLELKPFDGFAGVIALAANGAMFHAETHPQMVWASFDGEARVFT